MDASLSEISAARSLADSCPPDDRALIDALRAGDEAAFARMVEAHHAALIRLAMSFVATREIAEEVVQETWVGVLQGLDRFEGRSSLKTWIFRILTNQAKTRGVREQRSIAFSQLGAGDNDPDEPAVDPDRFLRDGPFAEHWAAPPERWEEETPERVLLSKEGLKQIECAVDRLPQAQRQILILRDIEGSTSEEACNVLDISETNQRVLLHRARSKVRRAIENYLRAGEAEA